MSRKRVLYPSVQQPLLTPTPATVIFFETPGAVPQSPRQGMRGVIVQEPIFITPWFATTDAMPDFVRRMISGETLTLPVETPAPPPPPPPPTTIPGPVGGGDNSLIRGQIPPGPRRGDILSCSIQSEPLSFIAAASCALVVALSVSSRPMRCIAQGDVAQVMATTVQSTPAIFTAEARAVLGTDANDVGMLGLPDEEII